MQDICVRYGTVRQGTARCVTVRHGTERHGSTYKTSLIYFTNTSSFSKYNCLIFICFKHKQNIFCRNIWLLFEYLCRMGVHKRNSILTGHKSIAFSMTEAAKLSYAPFTLLRFCTKTEKKYPFLWNRSHYSTQKRTKTEVFKVLFKVDIHKNGAFWNAVDQCERTKTDKKRCNSNNKILHTFLAKVNVELEENKNLWVRIH